MKFLKVVYGGQLVDEDGVASLELECPAPIENTHDKGELMDGGEFFRECYLEGDDLGGD